MIDSSRMQPTAVVAMVVMRRYGEWFDRNRKGGDG